ncbi:acyl-CoA desaturase [Arthrobacter sp. H5]|uniref:fatty acid desaturase family protein n=1 Tax=Arthrobacter sp. H5 TaxID=1267973 RepID=UPI0004B2E005|nr:acyl-CoA desaturase [Arthrobacter sp. H5]
MTTLSNDSADISLFTESSTQETTVPRIRANKVVGTYANLLRTVRDAGLLRRRRRFYLVFLSVLLSLFGAAWTGFVLLGDSWFQLIIAGVLGILLTQFAFYAHEAAHHQVFRTRWGNDWSARVVGNLFVGMSFAYWMDKHGRHHTHPNQINVDPDIATGAVVFHEEGGAGRSRLLTGFTRIQGYFLFPLLLFLGFTLHVDSIRYLLKPGEVRHRGFELAAIGVRLGGYLAIVFLFLPVGMAFAFVGVQVAVFGLYMGASFAPNHKGMPVIPEGSRVDFLSRQVLTSRSISGGRFIRTLMGGLNHQVEHHLFPDMARPNLRRAREIVKDHCAQQGIPYTETSLIASYGIVMRYLNEVGLKSADPFECPAVRQYR